MSHRFDAIDRLRGLIMVVMAIDHASYFIARMHPAETWAFPPPYYDTPLAFFTRWITHLCAPGFFLLMGAGMGWFSEARLKAGWSRRRIARHFVTRGLLLLGIQHLVENPAWVLGELSGAAPEVRLPGDAGDIYVGFAVITALGASMIFWSVFTTARAVVIAALVVVAMGASMWMTPSPEHASNSYSVGMRLLFVPGRTGVVQALYAVVPWLVPAGLGLLLARTITRQPSAIAVRAALAGLFLIALFVTLRRLGVGDYHAPTPGAIGFLTLTKYPPSLDFLLVTLGLDLILLAILSLPAIGGPTSPLATFGRAPLFFYLLHLYVFGVLSFFFPRGTTFAVMYVTWAGAVVAMYPVCRWYAAFKSRQPPNSIWRLL